jgi:hypothetical protein
MIHAVALRDLLRGAPDDPHKTALAWDEVTRTTVDPYYDATVTHDRHRLGSMQAAIEGRSYEGDADWRLFEQFSSVSTSDPELFRSFLDIANVLAPADAVLSRPEVVSKTAALARDPSDDPPLGPTREQAVAIAGG